MAAVDTAPSTVSDGAAGNSGERKQYVLGEPKHRGIREGYRRYNLVVMAENAKGEPIARRAKGVYKGRTPHGAAKKAANRGHKVICLQEMNTGMRGTVKIFEGSRTELEGKAITEHSLAIGAKYRSKVSLVKTIKFPKREKGGKASGIGRKRKNADVTTTEEDQPNKRRKKTDTAAPNEATSKGKGEEGENAKKRGRSKKTPEGAQDKKKESSASESENANPPAPKPAAKKPRGAGKKKGDSTPIPDKSASEEAASSAKKAAAPSGKGKKRKPAPAPAQSTEDAK